MFAGTSNRRKSVNCRLNELTPAFGLLIEELLTSQTRQIGASHDRLIDTVPPDMGAALRLMECERFDLYVLDGGLRRVDGLSLCEQIRPTDARAPIVIFSGHAFAADIKAGMLAGANAYLVKPDSSELIHTISRLLQAAA